MTTTTPYFTFHPDRKEAIAEANARPVIFIDGPFKMLHIAFHCSQDHRAELFKNLGDYRDANIPQHIISRREGITIKLERHTEFLTATLICNLEETQHDLMQIFSERFMADNVTILVMMKMTLVNDPALLTHALPENSRNIGGVIRRTIDLRTSLEADKQGIIHYAAYSKDQDPDRLGRRIQRIVEMETYRTMCLIGLPLARRQTAELWHLEEQLDELIGLLRNENRIDMSDEQLFHQLSALSEKITIMRSNTNYRFDASQAYYNIVIDRLGSFEEVAAEGLESTTDFVRARLDPAMATIKSTGQRQQKLAKNLTRAIALLRTRLELNINLDNRTILKSMDSRHRQQLKISQTVEGLSVVAISYYSVGLISYAFKALEKLAWFPTDATTATMLSVPIVVLTIWLMLRRLRTHWES